jgi:hypothetical protein
VTSAGFAHGAASRRAIIMSMNAPFSDLPAPLRPFVRDGRITALPAKRSVRMLLLDEVAQAFEPGRRYDEPAVNEILKALCDDHAALRRYLVDEELMSRTPDGIYWRSGGTVLVD